MTGSVNPYKVLNVPKHYTLEQLRANYKKIAVTVHPDKPNGSDYLFKLVTTCYKALLKEHERRKADKQYTELKNESAAYMERQGPGEGQGRSTDKANKFDVSRFNKVFEENRIGDVNDDGYGRWMAPSSSEREDIDIKNKMGKFSSDAFNKEFEGMPVKKPSKSVTQFSEPAAMTGGPACSELGVTKVTDFSAGTVSGKSLNYMDYKKAHTTSRLVDPNAIKVKEWRSIEELEHSRAKLAFTMSDDEKRAYERARYEQELQEKRRVDNLRSRDAIIERHFNQMNRLMLR